MNGLWLRKLVILISFWILASCGFTSYGDFVRSSVESYGSDAYDEGIDNALFFLCRATSVGSVVRRFGSSEAKLTAWSVLCLYNGRFPTIPEGSDGPSSSRGFDPPEAYLGLAPDFLGPSVAAGLEPFTNKGL